MSAAAGTETFDAMLSDANRRFRELACRDERLLRRSAYPDIDRANPLLMAKVQPWPTFVGRRMMGEIGKIAVGLSELIRSLPERLFGSDAERIANYFGLDPGLVAAALTPPNGIDGAIARADFLLTAGGFRCIEFNIASSIGSWQPRLVADMLLRAPALGDFLRNDGVRYVYRSPVRELFLHCIREKLASPSCDGKTINTGIGMEEPAPPATARMLDGYLGGEYRMALREVDPALTGSLLLCPYNELEEAHGVLYLRGVRLDALVEWHTHGTQTLTFRCAKAGTLDLYDGPVSAILADKRCLALLSTHAADEQRFTPEEASFIHRYLPWTRRVLPGGTSYRGEPVTVPEMVIARQPELVLKKASATSAGGADVVVGKFTPPEAWADLLRRALEQGNWIVQEVLESLPFLYQQGPEGCGPNEVIWGPFVFGRRFAGTGVRVAPRPELGVVSVHHGAGIGLVFEVDEE
jgi:hypothetical protein